MPLTVNFEDFKSKTKRDFPRYRSKRMDDVLKELKLHEKDDSATAKKRLEAAVATWILNDPKEFGNRDKISSGLCRKLANELRVPTLPREAKQSLITAYELTKQTKGGGAVRCKAKTTSLKCSLEDQMFRLHDEGQADRVGILVIDMQAKPGGKDKVSGADVRYNSNTVTENQASALEAAAAYGMHVFEIRITRVLQGAGVDGSTVYHNDPTVPELKSLMPAEGSSRYVAIDKPFYNSFQGTSLADELRGRSIGTAIVMGFDANLCVLNTIFGTPEGAEYTKEGTQKRDYIDGLLDRDLTVITSRVILAASAGARLAPDYNISG